MSEETASSYSEPRKPVLELSSNPTEHHFHLHTAHRFLPPEDVPQSRS